MVEKLSAEDRGRLNQALASWESWSPAPSSLPKLVTQLGGDSNLSFVVSDGIGQWVLRLNNQFQDSGINRSNEWAALQAASKAGISPLPNFHNSEVLLTPFIVGKQATLVDLSDIGRLFSRIHSLDVELAPIDLLEHLNNYYEKAEANSLLRECHQHIVDFYPQEIVELKPCHNDCLLPNMIRSEQGLQLLDWEYAAAVDPAYDLAVFSAAYGLDEGQLGVLLAGYGQEGVLDVESLKGRISYFEKYYCLVEVLWYGLRGRDMGVELGVLAGRL